MASNGYHWSSERVIPKKSDGKHEVDTMTLLAGRMDVLAQKLDRVGVSPTPSDSSCSSLGLYAILLDYMLYVRLLICRGTHPLSAITTIN